MGVDPGRAAGLEHDRREVLPPKGQLAAIGDALECRAPRGEVGDRAVGLVAAHARVFDRKQPPDFLHNRSEHLLRRRAARHERRDPPQRRLLLGELRRLKAMAQIRASHQAFTVSR